MSEEAEVEPRSHMTYNEMAESTTGWEDRAVRRYFESSLGEMNRADDGPLLLRALVFCDIARGHDEPGSSKAFVAAYKEAMGLSMKAVNDWFAPDEADEVDEEDPITESGKDSGPLV